MPLSVSTQCEYCSQSMTYLLYYIYEYITHTHTQTQSHTLCFTFNLNCKQSHLSSLRWPGPIEPKYIRYSSNSDELQYQFEDWPIRKVSTRSAHTNLAAADRANENKTIVRICRECVPSGQCLSKKTTRI